MSTNAELITELATACKDAAAKERSRTIYAAILTKQQDFIVEKYQLLQKVDSTTLTAAASTDPVGNMPTDFIGFLEESNDLKKGQISIGTNGKVPLDPISLSQLDEAESNWRAATAGTPRWFYLIQGAVVQLGIFPKASATWITANGNSLYIQYAFRPEAIADNSNYPFGNSQRFRGLEEILVLRGRRHVALLDGENEKADRLELKIDKELSEKEDIIRAMITVQGPPMFARNWRP